MNFLSILGGIGLRAWGYIAAAAGAVFGLLALFGKVKQAGRDQVATATNTATAASVKHQLDAAVNAPKTGEGVANAADKGRY